jgi:protein TonB
MSDKTLNMTDITEIIFANKNKEYGAYVLRTLYNKYVTISTIIGTVVFVLALTGPMIYKSLKPAEAVVKKKLITLDYTQLSEPPSLDKATPPPTVDVPPPLKSTIAFLPPVVKPDEQVSNDVVPTVEDLKKVDPGAKTQEGQEGGVDYSLIETQEKIVDAPKKEEAQVFTYVEEMPTFPGGDDALYSFISKQIQYPEIAKRAGVEGKVYIQFVVRTDGKVSDVTVVKGIGAGCDEEAMKVVKSMPNWKPGRQNGHPVNVRISVPIVYKLQ